MSQHFHGSGGAPGIIIGQALRYCIEAPTHLPTDEDAETALERFSAAQHKAAQQLIALAEQLRTEGRNDEADILDTQALFVEDISLTDEVTRRVREEHEPLDQALDITIAQLRTTFDVLDDAYLRERAADIDAVGRTIRAALHGQSLVPLFQHEKSDSKQRNTILIAADLTPAETAELRGGAVAGFATAYGGATSHTAILARSLGIPAVVGLGTEVLDLPDDTELILDGDRTMVIAHPDPAERTRYLHHLTDQQSTRMRRQALRTQPGRMADEHRVALWANIGHPDDIALALDHGAEGIGLFRTEFLFMNRTAPPDEAEQYTTYRRVVERMAGHPVIIRTLDIGGDKPIPYLHVPGETNPSLGLRGIRLCMHQPHVLVTQLRALLRAATHGDLWVMFPMIATHADLAWSFQQVRTVAQSLEQEGIAHRADLPLGMMLETPAAAITADLLAPDVAFFSVGTNDLTQYTMAADRNIAALSRAYPHNSAAVLRLIAQAAAAARQASITMGVCGELASLPDIAPLLVGLGVDTLSMAPAAIPAVKEHLLTTTLPQAQAAARRMLNQR
jgi:phosphotransferase system enzyme I (PtsI)